MRIAGWWMAASLAAVVTTAFGEGTTGDAALTPVVVTLENEVQNWDGTPKEVAVKTEPAGIAVDVTYLGRDSAPTDPGAYPVVAEVAEEGYEGREEGSLVIVAPGEFMVVDLSGGTNAESFAVSFTDREPEDATDKLVFRKIPAGTYVMGSPEDEVGRGAGAWAFWNGESIVSFGAEGQRTVTISNDFWLGVSKVMYTQARLVNGGEASQSYDDFRGKESGGQWPPENVADEGSFLRVLRDKTGLAFDLPTEEQWEYACRAGTTTALNNGWNLSDTEKCPHLDEINGGHFPNAWGLYGMHGDGWEWCLDRSGNRAIVRGGSWYWNAAACRSATRGWVARTNSFAGWRPPPIPVPGMDPDPCYARLACGTSNLLTFERIGTREWTERVELTATTGTDGIGQAVVYEVLSGVGRIEDGCLAFSGPGTTVVKASLAGGASVTQTVTAMKATAAVRMESLALPEGPSGGVETTTEPPGLSVEVLYDGGTTVPTTAGAHTVTATVQDGRYTGSAEGALILLEAGEYLEVDLSGGPEATRFATRVVSGPPAEGWGDEHKTTKLLLRKVEAGTYTMGGAGELGAWTNEPRHSVSVEEPHWLGVFEVTQKQWELVTGGNPSGLKGDMRPVDSVGLEEIRGDGDAGEAALAETDAASFLGVLRAKTGLTFDLPTEEQWEQGCRAGTTTALNIGWNLSGTNECPRLGEAGRYTGNSGYKDDGIHYLPGWYGTSDGRGGITNGHTVVGSYVPNAWGFYDMHGNVRELCRNGMERGGGWADPASVCRSASRRKGPNYPMPDYYVRPTNMGFRVSCATGRKLVFEPIGTRTWAESVALRASTGTDGLADGVMFEVVSGPGAVEGGVLRFSGPGEVVVRATSGTSVVAQTVRVERVQAKVELKDKVHTHDGTAKRVTVETEPAGLEVAVTYDGTTNEPSAPGAYRVVARAVGDFFEGVAEGTMVIVAPGRYRVVDLSGGPGAKRYPVEELDAVPEGGWGDEHKTEKLVLRWVAPGSFTMGSATNETGRPDRERWTEFDWIGPIYWVRPLNEPQHRVTLSEGYWMGVFETTQKQWELVMGKNPAFAEGAMRPVEGVSYDMIRGGTNGAEWPATNALDAGSFMAVLQAKTGLPFDLPTEAQWEMACRAGTTSALNSGWELEGTNECPHVAEVGLYAGNRGGADGTRAVGSFLPNVWGLFDMHGNVAEWCLDWNWYGQSYNDDWELEEMEAVEAANAMPQTDPAGASNGTNRVIKGGSWKAAAWQCRSASRDSLNPDGANSGTPGTNAWTGFRVACGAREAELPEEGWTEGSPVAVPWGWLAGYGEALAAAGGDYEAAAVADFDGDGAAAWEEYVAGTSPEDKGDVFKVTGWTWKGGEMVPEYGPKDEDTRTYTVEAADGADGAYKPTAEMDAAEGRRFYRVRVEMK